MPKVAIALLVLVLGACGLNYQQKFAGNIPLKVVNKSSTDVGIFIHKPDGTVMGKRWGEPIKPGAEVTYMIAPGDYKFVADFDRAFPDQNEYGSTYFTIQGAQEFVLTDNNRVQAPPGATLIVMGQNPETELSAFEQSLDESQGSEPSDTGEEQATEEAAPTAACKPDGAKIGDADHYSVCCSGESYVENVQDSTSGAWHGGATRCGSRPAGN